MHTTGHTLGLCAVMPLHHGRGIMKRIMGSVLIVVLVVFFGLSYAQEAASDEGVQATGARDVSISTRMNTTIPANVELSLDVTELTFDLRELTQAPVAGQERTMTCIRGLGADSVLGDAPLADASAAELKPLGTAYRIIEVSGVPTLEIQGGTVANDYALIDLDASGEMVEGSNAALVCYRSFTLDTFVNTSGWRLSVERNDPDSTPSIRDLYIRSNNCDHSDVVRGLYRLDAGQSQMLASGDTPLNCENLIVIALKVQADQYGEHQARLTYTLVSNDAF